MIKVDQHPAYTIQVGKCIAEFDRDYALTVRKIINGKTTYEVEFFGGFTGRSCYR